MTHTTPDALVLERRAQPDLTAAYELPQNVLALFTPPITPGYWAYRVVVADGQAVLGFPKFTTIGVGFAVEKDWNRNLPYTKDAETIRDHIWPNRGPLPDTVDAAALVVRAIELIQDAARADLSAEGDHE